MLLCWRHYAECRYAECPYRHCDADCRYVECHNSEMVLLSVVTLSLRSAHYAEHPYADYAVQSVIMPNSTY
jgi:hypothetical protein